MDIFEFASKFNTEEKCRAFLKEQRQQYGITCKNCSGQDHFYLEKKQQWQCRACDYRTTLTSGTIFENTKLPLQKWMLALFWMASSKKSISTLEMMRKLNLKRFETVSNLMKKIRLMMRHYNETIMAGDHCEADESFIVTSGTRNGAKRGRGTEQTMVHILAPYDQRAPTGNKSGKALKNIRMDVIDNAASKSIKQVWDRYLTRNSKVTMEH